MKTEKLTLGHIASNCYMVSTDTAAIIIDPGKKADGIEEFLKANKDKQVYVLLTHRHFDHLGAVGLLKRDYNIISCIHTLDKIGLEDTSESLSDRFFAHQVPSSADIVLNDGDVLQIGDLSVEVIYTPGHTVGSVCYKIGNALFTGDTLMKCNVGRTDLPSGDTKSLMQSLKKLKELEGDYTVYPGHGDNTTLNGERKNNPYLDGSL